MNKSTLALAENHLYDDTLIMRKSGLTERQINAVIRIRDAYTLLRDNPRKKDREIIDHLIVAHDIEKSQAYNDLKIVKYLIGSIEDASRDWHRFNFNRRNDETRELAKKWKNANAMARCDHDYAKFNKLDQDEAQQFDWESIQVQPFVPTSDPSVIGIKPIANINEKIAALEKQYEGDLETVDVDYVDVTFNPEDIFKTDTEIENDKWK